MADPAGDMREAPAMCGKKAKDPTELARLASIARLSQRDRALTPEVIGPTNQ